MCVHVCDNTNFNFYVNFNIISDKVRTKWREACCTLS